MGLEEIMNRRGAGRARGWVRGGGGVGGESEGVNGI